MQQQRLLDLGAVEQVAAALGRELRVVGQHDRRAQHRVVGSGVASTGKVFTLSSSGVLERRHEAAAGRGHDHVGGEQARCAAPPRGRRRRRRTAWCCARTRAPAAARRASGSTRSRARPSRPSKANGHRLARAAGSSIRRSSGLGGARRWPAGSAPWPTRARPRPPPARSPAAGGRRPAGSPLGVGGRVDDPERRGRGVLGGVGRVRVERVALVEQRLDQLVEVAHDSRPPRAVAATVASKVGSPAARLARRPARSSVVSSPAGPSRRSG